MLSTGKKSILQKSPASGDEHTGGSSRQSRTFLRLELSLQLTLLYKPSLLPRTDTHHLTLCLLQPPDPSAELMFPNASGMNLQRLLSQRGLGLTTSPTSCPALRSPKKFRNTAVSKNHESNAISPETLCDCGTWSQLPAGCQWHSSRCPSQFLI